MKVCKYCGTENPNNAVMCENCGAHEFKHKCNNCGTLFEEGEYCPKCGVKAGQRPRVCPNCGREYYSNACPTCGYVKGGNEKTPARAERVETRGTNQPIKPVKKRKTWLWVLGWIIIFPLPLTILLLRKKNMKPVLKYGIIAVAWIFYLLFIFAGKSGETSNPDKIDTAPASSAVTETEQPMVENNQSSESPDNTNDANSPSQYAEDAVVNRFITEFNNTYDDDIVDISKGNIRTKYYGYIRDTRIEMINANDAAAEAFSISVYGGKEESDRDAMFASFREIAKILEPSLSDDAISAAINELVTGNVMVEKYQLGSTMLITYVPTKELSYGKNDCRVDILAYDYKETPSEEAPASVATKPAEMDALQTLFVSLSPSTTRDEIDTYIAENGMVKFAFTHDSAYYIGFESSAIRQRGRDRVGPAVDVNFVTNGDPDQVGTVKSAEYAVHTEASTHYALKYEDGVFYYEEEACASGYEAMQKYLSANQ